MNDYWVKIQEELEEMQEELAEMELAQMQEQEDQILANRKEEQHGS